MNSLDNAIAAAEEKANQVAPVVPASAIATPAVTGGTPMSLDDFQTQSLAVDSWLKVKDTGLYIGTDKQAFDELTVTIDLTEVQVCEAVRYGKPAVYKKTFDRVRAVSGEAWSEVLRTSQNWDQTKGRPYASADVPMYLAEEVKGKAKTFEEGHCIGYSLPPTAGKPFQKFLKDVRAAGLTNSRVKVRLSYEERSNGTDNYGVITFDLIGPAD